MLYIQGSKGRQPDFRPPSEQSHAWGHNRSEERSDRQRPKLPPTLSPILTISSSIRKKVTWQGRLRRLAKQTKASATSMLSKRMAAMKDIPWTCSRISQAWVVSYRPSVWQQAHSLTSYSCTVNTQWILHCGQGRRFVGYGRLHILLITLTCSCTSSMEGTCATVKSPEGEENSTVVCMLWRNS